MIIFCQIYLLLLFEKKYLLVFIDRNIMDENNYF